MAAARRNLSDAEFRELEELSVYGDIFVMKSDDYRRTFRVYHFTDTGEARPISQPLRRLPLAKQADVGEILVDMGRRGVIEASDRQSLVIPRRSHPEEEWGPALLHGL
jgi:hypothetical protein